MNIHPTAIVDPGAELDSSVIIGPYTIVEAGVRIDAGSEVGPHSLIQGIAEIGPGNKIGPFVNIGGPPQDMSYSGEETKVRIGSNNIIREYVSIHRGTAEGGGETLIGNENSCPPCPDVMCTMSLVANMSAMSTPSESLVTCNRNSDVRFAAAAIALTVQSVM